MTNTKSSNRIEAVPGGKEILAGLVQPRRVPAQVKPAKMAHRNDKRLKTRSAQKARALRDSW